MKNKIYTLLGFLLVTGMYVYQAAPAITAGDSGEFITTAATLSLAHPPAYPLYSVLNRCFMELIPWGAVFIQSNYFSAVLSGLSFVLLTMILFRFKINFKSAFLIALLFCLSTSMWLNSLVTEVFALNTAWVLLLLFVIQKAFWIPETQPLECKKYVVLGAFLLGLGLGNHHILVLTIPVLVALLYKSKLMRATLMWACGAGLIGFSVYCFLPVRSAQTPPLNWGNPTTIQKTLRVISRKDYGSLKLALGETPPRNISNTFQQAKRFSEQLADELPWAVITLGILGLVLGAMQRSSPLLSFLGLFALWGPFFYLLANLPFDAQSNGIMGRFFILPTLTCVLGFTFWAQKFPRSINVVLALLVIFVFSQNQANATAHRQMNLVYDYGNAMLRTMTPGSVLFMDGGDDAFYSLAALHYANQKRPDVELHDRGGLIYKNVYGEDFRKIPKKQKEARRILVEGRYLGKKDLFYATMNKEILPGVELDRTGFLFGTGKNIKPSISWPLIILRSLYPLEIEDYRTRALGPYFPYQRGNALWAKGMPVEALKYFKRAQIMGYDISWLKTNLTHIYSVMGYQLIIDGQYDVARQTYEQWIEFDAENHQAYSNLGVAYEKMGQIDKARQVYTHAKDQFPDVVDPVYNLAVLYWKEKNWPVVKDLLREVLKRDPQHRRARHYLNQLSAQDKGRS